MKKINVMKNVVTVFVCILLMLSSAFTAYAQEWEPRPGCQDAQGCVNGEPASGIYTVASPEKDASKIEYIGEGTLIGWEFPLLEEGKDYEILMEEDNYIIIRVFTANKEIPYINALVDFGDNDSADSSDETSTDVDKADINSDNQNESDVNADSLSANVQTTADTASDNHLENYAKYAIIAGVIIAVILCEVIIIVKRK